MFDIDLSFALPWLFALLPLPLISRYILPAAKEITPVALPVPFFNQLHSHSSIKNNQDFMLRLVLAGIIWLLLVTAAARPQYVGDPISLPVSGRDLMMAVDISGSMETEDMQIGNRVTNRLQAVKLVAGQFIDQRVGDRIGLILFGTQAYLQTPLTFDRKTIKTLLYEAAIGLANTETALGDAIGLAVKRLRNKQEQSRVLILLTDGANTAGHVTPLKAADLAASENIKIHTIGVGADQRRVRGLFGALRTGRSDLDEKTLKAIADKTGGRYFRARDIDDLQKIYALLDELEPIDEESQQYRPVTELYFWPLSLALVLSFLFALRVIYPSYRGHNNA